MLLTLMMALFHLCVSVKHHVQYYSRGTGTHKWSKRHNNVTSYTCGVPAVMSAAKRSIATITLVIQTSHICDVLCLLTCLKALCIVTMVR